MLFRDEQPVLSQVQFDQVSGPNTPFGVPQDGTMWYDATIKNLKFAFGGVTGTSQALVGGVAPAVLTQEYGVIVNTTPVSQTNPTSQTALMQANIPAGFLNSVNKSLFITASGLITTGVSSTIVFTVTLGSLTLMTLTSTALTTAQSNLPWEISAWVSVTTAGSSGALEAHGSVMVPLTAPAAAAAAFLDQNTAAVSTVDLTASQNLVIKAAFGSGNAGNVVSQRQMLVESMS